MMESIRRDDYGFFGPDSPSWKVWASPTALIGFQRAVVLEHFDPFLAAAVADSAGIYTDPLAVWIARWRISSPSRWPTDAPRSGCPTR